jgi:hypothetical protein
MSQDTSAVLDRPGSLESEEVDWVVVATRVIKADTWATVTRLQPRGHGRERYFVIPANELTALGRTPASLPSVDDIE